MTQSVERNPPRRRMLPLIFLALTVVVLLGIGQVLPLWRVRPAWASQNDVTTGAAPAYPELGPRYYAAPPGRVLEVMRDEAASIPRWRVVRATAEEVRVEVRTALFWFVDDLTGSVQPEGAGTRVVIRSHSCVGRGDLGENARHIAALQQRMDRALGR